MHWYWKMLYPHGGSLNEHHDGESIRVADRGAITLVITDAKRVPFYNVPLNPGEPIPVFYRRMSMSPGELLPRCDATVFGRTGPGTTTLWALIGSNPALIPCPPEHIDREAVASLREG